VVWASSTFVHYTDPAQDNQSTTLVGMSVQCSSRMRRFACVLGKEWWGKAEDNRHQDWMDSSVGDGVKWIMYGDMPLYICPGLLLLSRIPMLHTRILMPVQVPTMLKVPDAYAGCQHFTHQSFCLCRFPTAHTPILTLVEAPENSHANPYACEGSPKFQKFLTPVQASDDSHANPYACEGCQKF
ncbi:hypothetical protein O181_129311, partial [Austropuccinia psidii MF-1]|nr:hypothetical protein [Austropuccinia psidii MF-1]